jgi:2-polyprenyl-3-methyl-5-hydroxy-6-metoxy-1,4-benzoquinol methylase
MTDQSLDSVRQRFERDAKNFDAIYRLERSAFWRVVNKTLRKVVFDRYNETFKRAGDVTGKRILDIGCGSGVYAVDFARRGAAKVVGIDFSGNMLDIARAEAANHGVADKCEFVRANFLDYTSAQRFDIAIAMGVFDYIPDAQTFLNKMVSMADRVLIAFPQPSMFRKPMRQLRYKLTGRGSVHYYTPDDVRSLATKAGLTKIEIVDLPASGGVSFLVGGR